MHPVEAGLLAAVLAEPGDDAPRLVMADWYDEYGEPARAEFIRVQCQLAVLGECRRDFGLGLSCRCRFCTAGGLALRRREGELLRAEAVFWAADLPCPGSPENGTVWRRGFIEGVRLPAEHWQDGVDAILARCPLREVVLTTWPDWNQLIALTISRGRGPGVADTEETSATRWCLRRLWPGITFTLPRATA